MDTNPSVRISSPGIFASKPARANRDVRAKAAKATREVLDAEVISETKTVTSPPDAYAGVSSQKHRS